MKRRDFLKIATGSAGGAAAVGAVGARSSSASAALQEEDGNNTTSGNGTTGTAGNETAGNGTDSEGGGGLPGAGTTETVTVGPGGDLVFDPETLYIQRGTTVEWTWDSDNHNVNPQEQPEGGEWPGATELHNEGYTYSYTFEGPTGEYAYQCDPHANQGMTGSIVINESGEAPGGDGGQAELNPHDMGVPFQAHYVGIATILMVIVSLVYSFFVLKYGESQHSSAPNKQ